MSTYYPAVRAQADFACAVLAFIRGLLHTVLPSLANDRSILGTEEDFKAQMDAALVAVSSADATEYQFRVAVADKACGEVSRLCGMLTDACVFIGLDDIAKRYLDPKRFIRLVLKQDRGKLAALMAIVNAGDRNMGRLLMRVGAALEGRADIYDDMEPGAKRKATNDTKRIIAEVQKLAAGVERKIDDSRAEIIGRVDGVGERIDRLKLKGRRRSKYSDAQREACNSYWNAAQRNAELRYSSRRGLTHEAAFGYYRRELAKAGVTSAKQFVAILNSIKSKACAARRKELEAKQESLRKAKTPSGRSPSAAHKAKSNSHSL